jgi:thiol:disulfide interchange protein DsbD
MFTLSRQRAATASGAVLQISCIQTGRSVTLACLLAVWVLFACVLAPVVFAEDYLEPERAFQFSAKMLSPTTVEVTYVVADGYYMYRERFKFRSGDAKIGEIKLPPGKVKFDETFQKEVETYRYTVTILLAVEAKGPFTLVASGQGCADLGLCYPPLESEAKLTPPGASAAAGAAGSTPKQSPPTNTRIEQSVGAALPVAATTSIASAIASVNQTPHALLNSIPAATPADSPMSFAAGDASMSAAGVTAPQAAVMPVVPVSTEALPISTQAASTASTDGDSDLIGIEKSLKSGKFLVILPLFFLLGLGLSFTPCVLPMVPILSFIVVGEGAMVKRSRGFILSLTYSLGMAIVYTGLGVAAGLVGEGLAAALQNAWVLGAFALLMIALSLSMFGVYQLQVPTGLQTKLIQTSEKQAGGKLFGVFVMGAISALIVGPCVAAPLAGALVYISQTRDVLIGGGALFAMAIGMSVPLLLVGVSAGSLLPRAGAWMESVTRFFGVLMLAMALWIVSPVLPAAVQLLGWSAIGLGYGAFLLWSKDGAWLARASGLAFVLLGAMELIGAVSGSRDASAPLAHLRGEAQTVKLASFTRVKSVAELEHVLMQNRGKTALLDFYADWCVSCKEMEKFTFSDPAVQSKFANTLLLQVDVTANNAQDKEMLKRFQLFGPPGIVFFDKSGQELKGARVIGYQKTDKFLTSLAVLDRL